MQLIFFSCIIVIFLFLLVPSHVGMRSPQFLFQLVKRGHVDISCPGTYTCIGSLISYLFFLSGVRFVSILIRRYYSSFIFRFRCSSSPEFIGAWPVTTNSILARR